jgi:STAS domain-containing protein
MLWHAGSSGPVPMTPELAQPQSAALSPIIVAGGMPEGHFPVRQVGGLPVITSPAEIDIANAGELRGALLAAAKRGDASVVVDMSGTAFCDSTGAECTGAGA